MATLVGAQECPNIPDTTVGRSVSLTFSLTDTASGFCVCVALLSPTSRLVLLIKYPLLAVGPAVRRGTDPGGCAGCAGGRYHGALRESILLH